MHLREHVCKRFPGVSPELAHASTTLIPRISEQLASVRPFVSLSGVHEYETNFSPPGHDVRSYSALYGPRNMAFPPDS